MAKNRSNKVNIGKPMASDFGGAMLRMIAIGLAGGIALIAGAAKAGEQLEEQTAKHAAKKEKELEHYDVPLEEIEHYIEDK